MKISILQENLLRGVSLVSRMVASKAQLPVLANILIKTEEGKIRLSATNLETGVNVWLGGKIEKEGKITVPARIFLDLVNSLPKTQVFLEVEAEKIKVRAGKFKAVVNGIGADEFPEIPSLKKGKKEQVLEIKANKLKAGMSEVVVAAGVDEARPIFTGVKIEMVKKGIRMAATDGYRLSVRKIQGEKAVEGEKQMVVPARALAELVKAISQAEEKEIVLMAVTEEEKQLVMAFKEVEIVTRLLEGEFPDFDKIIPSTSTTKIDLNKEELNQAVRAAAIFARDSANIVKFKISSKGLHISANAPQVGENEVEVSGKKTGEDAEVAFNSRYLLEMLSVVEGENLRLETSGPLSPGMFKVQGDDEFIHIIMPVRVQG